MFSEISQFLCTWYIDNDVKVYVRKTFIEYYDRDRETFNDEVAYVVKMKLATFMAYWKIFMYALSEQAFDEAWKNLENTYIELFLKVITYFLNTWLTYYKRMFVRAWTQYIFFLGINITSRGERSHYDVKRELSTRGGHVKYVVE
jgi:hypothetical protein